MRIGLISDIHANLPALQAVFEALQGVDAILCAGDLTGYFTSPNEVMTELQSRQVEMIAGNHDVYLKNPPANPNALLRKSLDFTRSAVTRANADFLAALPCEKKLLLDGIRIAMFHGSPWNPQEQYIYPNFPHWEKFAGIDADVVVLGHTHRPVLKQVGQVTVINPGSVGQPRDGDPRASYALLDTQARHIDLARAEFAEMQLGA